MFSFSDLVQVEEDIEKVSAELRQSQEELKDAEESLEEIRVISTFFFQFFLFFSFLLRLTQSTISCLEDFHTSSKSIVTTDRTSSRVHKSIHQHAIAFET